MPSETEQLKRNVTYWQGQADEYKQVLNEMMALEQANHEAARELYAVLKEVEWRNYDTCVRCCRDREQGHRDNCPIGKVVDKYSEYGEDSNA